MTPPGHPSSKPDRNWLTVFLTLSGLWGVSVAQPLLDLLGRNTAFFVAHRADTGDLVAFALAVSFAAPTLLAVAVWLLARYRPRWGSGFERGLWAAMIALLFAQWLRQLPVPAALASLAAVVAAVLAAFALGKFGALRRFSQWLGGAVILFPLVFLVWSPVRKMAESPAENARSGAAPLRPVTAVVVILDEFPLVSLMQPDGTLDAARFPHFAALAATANWYRNATTVSQSTAYSVPAILSGRYPGPRKVLEPVWADYKNNLFTILGRRANLNVWETSTALCPRQLCAGHPLFLPRRARVAGMVRDTSAVFLHLIAPEGWRRRLPVIGESWRDFWSEPQAERGEASAAEREARRSDPASVFDAFLEAMPGFREPALHYAHLMTPHLPWNRFPDGKTYRTRHHQPHGLVNQAWTGSEWESIQAHQRHLLQVGWVDHLLGRLRQRLEELGRWQTSLVVVTSDHGAAFEAGGARRNLTEQNFVEIVNVPLFIKYPHQNHGEIDDSNVETVDIVPTILARFGAPIPSAMNGFDLAKARRRRSSKTVYFSGRRDSGLGFDKEYDISRLEERREILERRARRLGSGSWEALFDIGRYQGILGQEIGSLNGVEKPPLPIIVRLDSSEEFASVDLSADSLPAHVTGSLAVAVEKPSTSLAVVVNGFVRGVTESFVEDGVVRFTSLIPPEALISGANTVEILRIVGPPSKPSVRRLRPVELSSHAADQN